MKLVFIPAKNI